MKTFDIIKLLFLGLFFATTVHAHDPLPKIKNSADFQNFLEQGTLCENEWATANIFKGYGREQSKNRINRLRALEKMARRHHFGNKFFLRNNCNFELIIYPDKHQSQILSMDVNAIHIGRTESEAYFLASLNIEKDSIKRKLMEFGYKHFKIWHVSGEELFHPRNMSDSVNAQHPRNMRDLIKILVKECNSEMLTDADPRAKINTTCQKPSVFLGCYYQGNIGYLYQTCPW
jgi:hypothetical protein